MITAFASGTQTCTVTTEHFISSPNVQGKFRLMLDLNNLAAGDVLEVRAYKMALTSGTSRKSQFTAFYGAQSAENLVVQPLDDVWNELTDTNAVRFSIKQTFGTSRDIPYVILKDDALVPATSGRTVVVDASGLVDANTVKVGPTGSGTAQTAGDIVGDTNDIQTRLPAALVSGRIDSSVGAMAADVVTASAIAADAIGASELAASAVTEIQSGLSTLTASQVWATAIEAGYTAEQLLKIIAASTAGKSSGNEDNAPVFLGVDGTTARITGTVDAFGNRITSTLVGT